MHLYLYEEDSFGTFLLVSVILGGGCAWLAARAIAQTWRPWWHLVLYMLVLGFAVRFFHYALFGGTLSSLYYYVGGHRDPDRDRARGLPQYPPPTDGAAIRIPRPAGAAAATLTRGTGPRLPRRDFPAQFRINQAFGARPTRASHFGGQST